ncbi:carbohydrate ABC transporter permease [Paenibacillus sp. IB182496]|uniref:Carbohydrate ABC transporter permease n=1 Tax=Paenibacillus sabuli TaxID=2772509 RepID=A0A927GR05_9BACL|nr:carbohydrate ABC transporter permease [Paenibacillus sabuli]MBD2844307.1 carbohydrate ABC transporter permease [Paenibacillus sabuli]
MVKRLQPFDVFNILLLLLFSATVLYPFIYMISVSLSSSAYIMRGEVTLLPKGFTTHVYETIFNSSRIVTGYKNTIMYVVFGTTISLVLTTMAAYSLARKTLVMRKQITFFIIFTMLFNGGMIPTFLVVRSIGLLDTIWAMVLPTAISAWNLFVMRTFFQGMPVELEESGNMDGLGDIGVLTRIILPLSKPVLATIGLFYGVAIWNNFFSALLYLRDSELFPLQVVIRQLVMMGIITTEGQNSDEMEVDQAVKFATIIIGTLPIIMTYPFLQKYFVKGVLIGSVKG